MGVRAWEPLSRESGPDEWVSIALSPRRYLRQQAGTLQWKSPLLGQNGRSRRLAPSGDGLSEPGLMTSHPGILDSACTGA